MVLWSSSSTAKNDIVACHSDSTKTKSCDTLVSCSRRKVKQLQLHLRYLSFLHQPDTATPQLRTGVRGSPIRQRRRRGGRSVVSRCAFFHFFHLFHLNIFHFLSFEHFHHLFNFPFIHFSFFILFYVLIFSVFISIFLAFFILSFVSCFMFSFSH